jgi:biofilm PGA synthesis N-glycosyltransferase PgaC
VIVVDNGSTDHTYQVFQEQQRFPFRGQMHWISIAGRGKSYALNAGLHSASNTYICTIDADTVMHADALREMVRHFEADPRLGAATGTVEVLPVSPEDRQNRIAFLTAECEFQEYLNAFWLGRQGQTLNRSLYTLAGAFSFFRREVLLRTMLYDNQTVSEDTKVTFDIRRQLGGEGLVCIPKAIVYVTPTPSLSALYSQRVRWQRGEIEVAAIYQEMVNPNVLRLRGLALGRTLLIDHTFIFPRLVWTFLFPALYLFGYPLSLIVSASVIIYLFYIVIAGISALNIYIIATPAIRARLRRNWWIVTVIPAYHFLIFVFRLSGSIIALTEPAEWRVQAPWSETATAVQSLIKVVRKKLLFDKEGN